MSSTNQIKGFKSAVITKKYVRTYINFEGKETYVERGLLESDPEYITPETMSPYQWYCLPGGKGICTVPVYYFPNEKPISHSGEYGIFMCDAIPENKFITPPDLIKADVSTSLCLSKLEDQDDKKTIAMFKAMLDSNLNKSDDSLTIK